MKKILFAFALICSYGAFIISQHAEEPTTTRFAPVVNQVNQPTGTPTVAYKDGTYTGSAVDVIYGNVQVKVTISGGKISDVQFLDYPKDRSHSVQLSTMAMPILTQEAIQAQSANVNTVSGATETSGGFSQSLQTALNQAKA